MTIVKKDSNIREADLIWSKVVNHEIGGLKFLNEEDIDTNSLIEISNYLKPSHSWTNDIKQYGLEDETCLQIFYDMGNIENIYFRLDLRNISYNILQSIISFVSENEAMIITETNKVINPNIGDLLEEIKKSCAYKYIIDPDLFFHNFKDD